MSGFVVQCSVDYNKLGNCGTYIEIHKPNDPEILDYTQIKITYMSGFNMQYIPTKFLCTGRYEFWVVVRSRNGSTLQYVKPFFSRYPSCTDFQIIDKYKRNYKYYAAQPTSVNTIRLADGSLKKIEGHVDPPLPDWDAIDAAEAAKAAGTAEVTTGSRRLQ